MNNPRSKCDLNKSTQNAPEQMICTIIFRINPNKVFLKYKTQATINQYISRGFIEKPTLDFFFSLKQYIHYILNLELTSYEKYLTIKL